MIQQPSSMLKIRDIEHSLRSLSSQIKIMSRSQNHNVQSLQKSIEECVPLIKSKIQESEKHYKIKRKYEESLKQKQNRVLAIQFKKYEDFKRKTNVKSLIFSIKHKQASQIREQSIKHSQIVNYQKTRQQEEKIIKSQSVKNQQSAIKQKIMSFHKEKLDDISRIKKMEEEQKLQRIKKSTKLMQKIQQQKNLTHSHFNETHSSLMNLKSVMKRIKFMKPEDFTEMVNETFDQTINPDDKNLNYTQNNTSLHCDISGFSSPTFGRQSRFTAGEQIVTSKILNKLLSNYHTNQEKSFC